MFDHHPIFPRDPIPPLEAPGHLNLGFLKTDDSGHYAVPSLKFFMRTVVGANEAELDMFYAVVRAHRRRYIAKSVGALIVLTALLSIPLYFLPRAVNQL